MRINDSGIVNPRVVHYQKKFSEFEKILSDQYKKTYQGKKMIEDLKSIMTEDQLKVFDVDNFTRKIAFTKSQYDSLGQFNRPEYTYHSDEGHHNDITLVENKTLDYKYGVKYKIMNNHVETTYSHQISDDQLKEVIDLSSALDRFIRYANGQGGTPGLDKTEEENLMSLLSRNGVDTNKAFVANGIEFNTEMMGKLEKTGVESFGFTSLPDYVIKKQFNAYAHELGIVLDWEDEKYL